MVDEFNQAKRRRSSRKSAKRKSRRSKKPLNAYFKKMLAAKKAGKLSFEYNGNTYVGRRHENLGLIYRRR